MLSERLERLLLLVVTVIASSALAGCHLRMHRAHHTVASSDNADSQMRINRYERRCAQDDRYGCEALVDTADDYLAGDGVERDALKAALLYRKACVLPRSGRNAVGCPAMKRAFEKLGCADKGNSDIACYHFRMVYGQMFRDGDGVDGPPQHDVAFSAFSNACSYFQEFCLQEDPAECTYVVTRNKYNRVDDFRQLSEVSEPPPGAEIWHGCAALGNAYAYEIGTEQDLKKAFDLSAIGCDEKPQKKEDLLVSCRWVAILTPDEEIDTLVKNSPDALFKQAEQRVRHGTAERVWLLELACDAGHGEACGRAGVFRARGESVPASLEKGEQLLTRACELSDENDRRYCDVLAKVKKLREQSESGRRKCNDGNAESCYELAHKTLNGRSTGGHEKAIEYFRQACDAEYIPACIEAGELLYIGNRSGTFPTDPKRAVPFLEKACEVAGKSEDTPEGRVVACAYLGYIYTEGEQKDFAKSVSYSRKACELGYADACTELAYRYAEGEGVRQNGEKAIRIHKKACNMGAGDSCQVLKVERLREWFRKRRTECLAGRGAACNAYAAIHANGGFHNGYQMVEPSEKKAVKFFRLGCENGHAMSCGNIAGIYFNGDMGVERDTKKGKDYARRACKGGVAKWCRYAR